MEKVKSFDELIQKYEDVDNGVIHIICELLGYVPEEITEQMDQDLEGEDQQ